jgi:hypothetical protein
VALWVAHNYHLGVAAAMVTILVGLPALHLAWSTYRDAGGNASIGAGLSLAKIADELARAVRSQWEAEAKTRRLNDPYPLPVSWRTADQFLTDPWDSLVKLADTGAGWPRSPDERTWAAGPDDLAGKSDQLVKLLDQVPTRRLVVLGEPGSGKTMLMVRLVLDLLARRSSGEPVPALVGLASWDPANQDLHSWLAAQLVIDHPAMAAAGRPGLAAVTASRQCWQLT